MEHNQLKTEFEMMMKLALVAVRLDEDFIADDSQYTMPDAEGNTRVYDLAFLDISFIESGLKDSVVKFIPKNTDSEPLYCLLSVTPFANVLPVNIHDIN